MSFWYYTSNGAQFGPVSEAELRAYLSKNLPTDKFKGPGMDDWIFASEVEAILRGETPQRMLPHVNESGEVQCIKCGSTQVHSGQRGYSFLRGGIFGSSQIIITCLRCGQKFHPGGKPY